LRPGLGLRDEYRPDLGRLDALSLELGLLYLGGL
jgi:hypothetical protein